MTRPYRTEGILHLDGGDNFTSAIQVSDITKASIQLDWSGVTNFDGTFNIEGSMNLGQTWNRLSGSESSTERLINLETGTQIFTLQAITTDYLRIAYKANSNTTGNLSYIFQGYVK